MRISDWSSDVCSSDLGWGFETDPAKAAADAFKQELGKRGITVTGGAQRTVAPPSTEVAPADEEAESAEEAPDGLTPGTELAAVHSAPVWQRSEEHTSELQSLMRISYAVFCLKKKKKEQDD